MTITASHYRDAREASDAIGVASQHINTAAKLLDSIPSRYMPQLDALPDAQCVGLPLAAALTKLAAEIAAESDDAVDRSEDA